MQDPKRRKVEIEPMPHINKDTPIPPEIIPVPDQGEVVPSIPEIPPLENPEIAPIKESGQFL